VLLFPEAYFFKIESEQIFTIVILQFKTCVRTPLTSQIKELGAILQKLIKFEPGLIQTNENNEHLMASMAMRMSSDLGSSELGSVQRRKRNENRKRLVLTRTRTNKEKKAVLVSVKLVKRKLLKNIIITINNT
jgi:hypothetical protein